MSIGTLVPLCILLFFICDMGLRYLPIQFFVFRPWEAVVFRRSPYTPGCPNLHLRFGQTYGDLAALANLPEMRQYRLERLTTDANGFRNRESIGAARFDIAVLGDSFAFGDALDDDDTLPAQLARVTGKRVYNAAGADPRRLPELMDNLPVADKGTVIFEVVERNLTTLARYDVEKPAAASVSLADAVINFFHLKPWVDYSPLHILCVRALKMVQNDVVLPNPYREQALAGTLSNGTKILFFPFDKQGPYATVSPPLVSILYEAAGRAAARGLEFKVVIVPNKSTLYSPLLKQPDPEFGCRQVVLAFKQALAQKGIPCLDLTAPLAAAAREAYSRGQYIYWLDDTHWNASGAGVAARHMKQVWFTGGKEAI